MPNTEHYPLAGVNAVVLGGTRGLGRECTLSLLRSGARVLATGRALDKADFPREVMAALSLLRYSYPEQAMHEVVAAARGMFGDALHALIHCFGPVVVKPIGATSPAELSLLLQANAVAFHEAAQAFAPQLADNRGRIVAFSVAGADTLTSKHMLPAYFAAKSAQLSLVRSWARELAPRGITVNAIGLGAFHGVVNTDVSRVPMGRHGTGDDIGAAMNFLLAEDAGYITGAFIPVSGGYSI
jgi:NAD(P)-dependent dehydrogenase (short-subunit alcohol dehydrogenase family)